MIPEKILNEVRQHHATLYDCIDNVPLGGDDRDDLFNPPLNTDDYNYGDDEAAFCVGHMYGVADALDLTVYKLVDASTAGLERFVDGEWRHVEQATFFQENEGAIDLEQRQEIVRLAPGEEFAFADVHVRRVDVVQQPPDDADEPKSRYTAEEIRLQDARGGSGIVADHEAASSLICERKFQWCRARLLHALAGAAEQDVLREVVVELLPNLGDAVHGRLVENLKTTGWLKSEDGK